MTDLVKGNLKDTMASADAKRGGDVYMIEIDKLIVREGFNEARMVDPTYSERVEEYAEDMRMNGYMLHKPMLVCVTVDGVVLLDGHTRRDAVYLANSRGAEIVRVPVVNEAKGTTEDDRIASVVKNNNGARLTPLGEAIQAKKLMQRGHNEAAIAKLFGWTSPQKVSNLLTLLSAPKEITDMVATGSVSATLAQEVIRTKGKRAAQVLEAGAKAAKDAGKTKVTKRFIEHGVMGNPITESPLPSVQAIYDEMPEKLDSIWISMVRDTMLKLMAN